MQRCLNDVILRHVAVWYATLTSKRSGRYAKDYNYVRSLVNNCIIFYVYLLFIISRHGFLLDIVFSFLIKLLKKTWINDVTVLKKRVNLAHSFRSVPVNVT